MNDQTGVPQFTEQSRTAALEARIAALESQVAKNESELAAWRNLTVDPASGGGSITVGSNQVFLRINSLTGPSAQLP